MKTEKDTGTIAFRFRQVLLYITIILPVVLYGCETWSLTLREERRLRSFEKRLLRRRGDRGVEKTT